MDVFSFLTSKIDTSGLLLVVKKLLQENYFKKNSMRKYKERQKIQNTRGFAEQISGTTNLHGKVYKYEGH